MPLLSFSLCLFPQAINIIECPEFQSLLLHLRSDLQDTMIPRRSKLRLTILDAWRNSFESLKKDLAVRFFLIFFRLLKYPD